MARHAGQQRRQGRAQVSPVFGASFPLRLVDEWDVKRQRLREEARQHIEHGQDDSLLAWVQADRLIDDLSQLPDRAWVRIPRPEDGYHFLCRAYVQGFPVEVLLDGGAVFSLIWEAALAVSYTHLTLPTIRSV